jgi:outer membrane protein assembly factor BamB
VSTQTSDLQHPQSLPAPVADTVADASAARKSLTRTVVARMAAVTGAFSALMALALLVVWASAEPYPLEDWPEMRELQQARLAAPADTDLVEQIRLLDSAYRTHYLRRQHMLQSGAMLLAAGLTATLGLLRWRAALIDIPPQIPEGGPEFMDRTVAEHHAAVGGVLGIGAILLTGLLLSGLLLPEIRRPAAADGDELVAAPPNWPRFRGPTGDGHVPSGQWPQWWDGPSGAGIAWKQELPLEGKSSPVVWDDRVFVTAGDKNASLLLCLSAESGEILWSRQVQSPPPTTSEASDPPDEGYTGWAAPTPATDGQFVFVTYANADIVCFDFDGNQRWARNYGPARSSWGLATSLVLYRNLVIWQMDQGREPTDGLSWLIALDKRSGREVWRRARPSAGSWATPILIEAGAGGQGDMLIVVGDPHVMAYDPATGNEIWRAGDMGTDPAPSPVASGGLVFAAGENGAAYAILLGGAGDVSTSHIVWESQEGLPATVSPLAAGEYYLHVSDQGAVTCLSAATGEKLWQEEFRRKAQPSPALVDDIVYLLMGDGTMLRFRLGSQFELLSISALGEETAASPAFSDGRIFIRGKKHLYCIVGAEPPADGSEIVQEDSAPVETEQEQHDDESAPPDADEPAPAESDGFAPPTDDIFG